MRMTMMQSTVRDPEVEEKVYDLLVSDPDKIWNVSLLTQALECSRAKIERAFIALETQDRITVQRLVGNSLIPRLKKTPDGAPRKIGRTSG